MLRNTPNTEAVIVEYGFLDNANDANRLKNNYKKYADAVIDAILDYKQIQSNVGNYYIVKKGDSLWSIANNNNTTVSELKTLNNLTNNTLSIGKKLLLPSSKENTTNNTTSNTHTVKSGDTLYSIAKKYGVSINDLKTTNNLTNNTLSLNQTLIIPGLNNNTTPSSYTVKKGDTLYSIANKYGISVNDLKEKNNLTKNTLSIGQVLLLPSTTEENVINSYTVKNGDTLYSIANKYNITVDELKNLNNLTNNTLSIGQTLKVRQDSNNILSSDYDYYTVKNGDTLYSIANKLDTTTDKLKQLNNLNTNILSIGQLLKIPQNTNTIYTVKKGDTLWSIAKDNNTTPDKIKTDNNLTTNNLYINQQLLIK